MAGIINQIAAAVEDGRSKQMAPLVNEAIRSGADPDDILNKGMIEALERVGEKYHRGEIFVPEMLVSARAMKMGVEALRPYLSSGTHPAMGKVLIGTVAGDLHDIGKNLVGMMLEGAGFEVTDLGIDVSPQKFIDAIQRDEEVTLVAISALLTATMPAMRDTVRMLNAQPFRDRIKIMVGGAPVTADFAREIGADGYSADAAEAVKLAMKFVSEQT